MNSVDILAPVRKSDHVSLLVELKVNNSVGRAADLIYTCQVRDVTGSIPGVSHIFRIIWIIIPACLIQQPNGTLSRMYVQTYISVK